VHLTTIEGRIVALVFTFPVGRGCCLFQYAYDPELSYFHLGLLSQYWVIGDALIRGMQRVSMLWGATYYKERLGARPERATHISVFPSQLARLHTLNEARGVGRRRLRERGGALYWRARHAAGRQARALLRPPDRGGPGDERARSTKGGPPR